VSVSLVIATFNHSRLLGEAIDSALAQTLGAVDVIVVDDGSIDDTPAALARYAGRIRVLRQSNLGLAAARNAGLAAARGTYVAFLDAANVMALAKLAATPSEAVLILLQAACILAIVAVLEGVGRWRPRP
jgi:glycosyltransferase involved in cell wall biosynthesis